MHFTVDDGLNALSDVIYHIESYDVTTIRASTPMFLLSRKIKAMGVKMVLSGEGQLSFSIPVNLLTYVKARTKS
jgi:asparagine synthase (glutamine-hydrolysing)